VFYAATSDIYPHTLLGDYLYKSVEEYKPCNW